MVMRKTGDTWVNESGDDIIILHADIRDGPGVELDYVMSARLDNESVMLAVASSGRSFLLTQKEALLLSRAINKRWPLDALSQI